ncbi:MAG: DegV family protein [Clostridia bacterium]|nr:DegV family protein [Clostridia bacterium]
MKTAIVTDSNSGITQDEGKELGVYVVPMPVLIDEAGKNGERKVTQYFEDISLTQDEFYEKLKSDASVSTSQPTTYDVGNLWTEVLRDNDEVIFIPMSSGLSDTCKTFIHYAESEPGFNGKVFVVDNQRISVTQRQSVMDAKKMADEGKSAKDIYDWLMETKMQSSIYIMVATMTYLKKGGRVTPAAAAIGTMLKIKPILQIQGEKLDRYKMPRKLSEAKQLMIEALKKDFETRFKDLREAGKMTISVAHTQNLEEAEIFREELRAAFPDVEFTFTDPLSLSVSCHIGPGALACTCCIKY